MSEIRMHFDTRLSVKDCAATFIQAVQDSYGGGRKLMKGLAAIGGRRVSGLEFFEPAGGSLSPADGGPTYKQGAVIPGYSKMHGTVQMEVHIYVVEEGDHRYVELVGPYSMGEKGSTERLVKSIADRF
jgi:hypothetical protein